VIATPTDFIEAGCIHDWLYRLGAVDRKLADQVYDEVLNALGMGAVRRKLRYFALRMFGGSSYKALAQTA
jgi:hypothetical protein